MDVDEFLEQPLGLAGFPPGDRRRGEGVDVGSGELAEQPEQPLLGLGEAVVGEGERRADAAVAGAQLGQPAVLVAQQPCQVRRSPQRTVAEPGGGDAHGERQVTAQVGDLADRGILPGDAVRSGDLGEQRPDLGGVGGIVEHHQRGAPHQQRSPERGTLVQPLGDPAPSTPSCRSSESNATSGASGPPEPWACRSANSCPSGNRSANRWPRWTDSAVLPTPAIPQMP